MCGVYEYFYVFMSTWKLMMTTNIYECQSDTYSRLGEYKKLKNIKPRFSLARWATHAG